MANDSVSPMAKYRMFNLPLRSSNRSWAYTGENFISPSASKICPQRKSTTTCKGTDHGLTSKLNIYKNIIKKYLFKNLKKLVEKFL